ncbi:hypothetical protein BU24DRAFT_462256 [Aaosphaeria arxii CBS 175.79]|uniref:Uncharacterized protein n=1 Tax=Aaosphaeria arxii CBS 175.79 TaxID=1450172 RepID=A0A6A5XRW2_9PLEO|nr:uncharacterized protein BU24DRAFT_462256 [Aaosphaeria arxii CBS 175.79]KAF2016055.1 hypothetical protein BU24DRAFT_462256 [Aaosphaeria arxii CBS 175.79]
MPPWGRPPGAAGSVGRYMEGMEDVHRYQEFDSEDEKYGAFVGSGFHKISPGRSSNPDELYFSDMDLRAWEQRNGHVYEDDYTYQEDEDAFDEAGLVSMSLAEYEENVFQGILEKVRQARKSGQADVQMTQEELEIYQSKIMRPKNPTERPQPAAEVPANATNYAGMSTSADLPNHSNDSSGLASVRSSSKPKQRASLFAPRPKKEKPSARKRSTSNATSAASVPNVAGPPAPAPGFVVPGPGGQQVYAPINSYTGRRAQKSVAPLGGVSSHTASRSSVKPAPQPRTPTTPTFSSRFTPSREMPGTFPSSPQRNTHTPTSTVQSARDQVVPPSYQQYPASDGPRQNVPVKAQDQSSSAPDPVKLVPFPVTQYQHQSTQPYKYHVPGQPISPQQTAQPTAAQVQYARRVVAGTGETYNNGMPRRVPVPTQGMSRSSPGFAGSQSDPAIAYQGSGTRPQLSESDDEVDVVPKPDSSSHKGRATRIDGKPGHTGGSSRDEERRKKSSRTKRKG